MNLVGKRRLVSLISLQVDHPDRRIWEAKTYLLPPFRHNAVFIGDASIGPKRLYRRPCNDTELMFLAKNHNILKLTRSGILD